MSAEHRPPRTLDVVPHPGLDVECQHFTGETPTHCENPARFVQVHEGQSRTREITTPRNVLACEECVPTGPADDHADHDVVVYDEYRVCEDCHVVLEDASTGLFQYCLAADCGFTAHWEGGTAAEDPALGHLSAYPDHTVRGGASETHERRYRAQRNGDRDITREDIQ